MSNMTWMLAAVAAAGIAGYVSGWVERGLKATQDKDEIERLWKALDDEATDHSEEIEELKALLSRAEPLLRDIVDFEPSTDEPACDIDHLVVEIRAALNTEKQG